MSPVTLLLAIALVAIVLPPLAVTALVAFGGPRDPVPLVSIGAGIAKRDRRDVPGLRHFPARDGILLSYRRYPPTALAGPVCGTAVLVHGSVGSSVDMHETARALSAAGIEAWAPDIRGHGDSGQRGDIAYAGQLDDDFADVLGELERQGASPDRVLIGHSSGGGYALRIAAGPMGTRFHGVLLLAPFIAHDAPTSRADGRWVSIGIGRIVALSILRRMGVHRFDHLPVLSFAVDREAARRLTSRYSFRLMENFGARADWRSDIAALRLPARLLVGADDELMYADRYADLFGRSVEVAVLPGVDHMGITGDVVALERIVGATLQLLGRPRQSAART